MTRLIQLAGKDLVAGSGGYRWVAPITSAMDWVAGTGLIWFEDLISKIERR